jgi:hypothetical protein
MHARLATYGYTGDPHEIAKSAQDGMLPIFRDQPGFRAYSIAESGGEIISLSVWDTAEDAEAANAVAADWIRENLADRLDLRDVRTGELLMSTTLDVVPA